MIHKYSINKLKGYIHITMVTEKSQYYHPQHSIVACGRGNAGKNV